MIEKLKIKCTKTKNGTKKDLFKNQLEIKDKINEIIVEHNDLVKYVVLNGVGQKKKEQDKTIWQKKLEEYEKILNRIQEEYENNNKTWNDIDVITGLAEQVIEELIKDNERLQKKQPPKECIEWLKSIVNNTEWLGSTFHIAHKLLKYFGVINE